MERDLNRWSKKKTTTLEINNNPFGDDYLAAKADH